MTQIENIKKLHLSNYTIITKIEKINKYLLLHGFSGAISLVSERLGNILINNKIEQLNKDEIDYFKSKYFITDKSLFEEKEELKKAYNKFEKIYKKGAGCSARAYRKIGTIFSKDCGEIDKYFPEIANKAVIQFLNEKDNEKNIITNNDNNIENNNNDKKLDKKEEVKEK